MKGLNDAIVLAAYAHDGQKDNQGEPYILHPLRVMLKFSDDTHRMVAVLHDVVEDTHITLDILRKDYAGAAVGAVDAITRRGGHGEGETYFDYIKRCALNPVAKAVKIADIHDNRDPARNPGPEAKELAKRYEKALAILNATEEVVDEQKG